MVLPLIWGTFKAGRQEWWVSKSKVNSCQLCRDTELQNGFSSTTYPLLIPTYECWARPPLPPQRMVASGFDIIFKSSREALPKWNVGSTWFSELRYSAFGETRYSSGITATDYRYTGQLQQADINLYYYNARFYDPALGRFVQSDTIVPQPGSIKGYDRYAYVNNNPLKYTDPSGHYNEQGTGGGNGLGLKKNNGDSFRNPLPQLTKQVARYNALPSAPGITYAQQAENSYDQHSYGARAYNPLLTETQPAKNDKTTKAVSGLPVAIDGLAAVQQHWVENDRDDFFVYVNTSIKSGGSLSVESITIRNTMPLNSIVVDSVKFTVTSNETCDSSGLCYLHGKYEYTIARDQCFDVPGNPMGIGLAGPKDTTTIPLINSGYSKNPYNTFSEGVNVTMWIYLKPNDWPGFYKPIQYNVK